MLQTEYDFRGQDQNSEISGYKIQRTPNQCDLDFSLKSTNTDSCMYFLTEILVYINNGKGKFI